MSDRLPPADTHELDLFIDTFIDSWHDYLIDDDLNEGDQNVICASWIAASEEVGPGKRVTNRRMRRLIRARIMARTRHLRLAITAGVKASINDWIDEAIDRWHQILVDEGAYADEELK